MIIGEKESDGFVPVTEENSWDIPREWLQPNVPMDAPDFVKEAEAQLANGEIIKNPAEVTIKFGKGLVGEPFTSKSGKELVEIKIPNQTEKDTRPWESFVLPKNSVHDNKFGKGVWTKIPKDGKTRLSRSVAVRGQNGTTIWKRETREVSNVELKSMMESYKQKTKDSVLGDLSEKKSVAHVESHSKSEKRKDITR